MITLPVGSTPIDFAYSVHTEVGHSCIGARVNGRLVPLDLVAAVGRHLRDLHVQGGGRRPSRDWLKIVVSSPRAATRSASGSQRSGGGCARSRAGGADRGAAPGGPAGAEAPGGDVLARGRGLNYTDLEACYVAIGEHQVSGQSIAQRVSRAAQGEEDEVLPSPPAGAAASARRDGRHPRRRPRRRDGPALALLHAGARRRDHRLRHPGSGCQRAPGRLRQRRVALHGPVSPPDRGRLGRRDQRRRVHRRPSR